LKTDWILPFRFLADARCSAVGDKAWTHIDGWSEAVVEYIAELEAAGSGATA